MLQFSREGTHSIPHSVGVWLQVLEEGAVLRTVGVATAGKNLHHWFLDESSLEAHEVYKHGVGAAGGTAATISARATVPGPEGLHTCAVLKLQVDGFGRPY